MTTLTYLRRGLAPTYLELLRMKPVRWLLHLMLAAAGIQTLPPGARRLTFEDVLDRG